MSEATERTTGDTETPQLSESELRQTAAYQKHRLTVLAAFVIGTVFCAFSFKPLGEALGALGAGLFDSLVASGTSANGAGLAVLLGANGAGFVIVLLLSLFVGPRVPSGFPHVMLGILVPLSLATMQSTMFGLTDGAGGLVDTQFARWSFVAMFLVTLATTEAGVTIGRRALEKRAQ